MRPWVRWRTHDSGKKSLYVIWKEKVEGPDGRPRWQLQRLHVKNNSEKTAGKIADKISVELAERGWINRPRKSLWTLGELAKVYLERAAQESPRSDAFRRARVAHLLRILGPHTPIEEITREAAAQYARTRLGEPWTRASKSKKPIGKTSAKTVNHDLSVLRRMLHLASGEWAAETGLSEYRLGSLKPLSTKGRERQPVFLSPEQRLAVLEASSAIAIERKSRPAVEAELAVRLALATGARLGEILAMRWEDLAGDRWVIRTEKGGRDRRFALQAEDLAAIRKLAPPRERAGAVFRGTRNGISRSWTAIRRRAGVSCRFHDLRHTFASVAAGLRPIRQLRDDLGHRTLRMTQRYEHFSIDRPPSESLSRKDLVPALVPARKSVSRKRSRSRDRRTALNH